MFLAMPSSHVKPAEQGRGMAPRVQAVEAEEGRATEQHHRDDGRRQHASADVLEAVHHAGKAEPREQEAPPIEAAGIVRYDDSDLGGAKPWGRRREDH